jgi:hypothetical protein
MKNSTKTTIESLALIGIVIIYPQLNMTFDRELVVLHTTPSMSGKLSVHAWSSYVEV